MKLRHHPELTVGEEGATPFWEILILCGLQATAMGRRNVPKPVGGGGTVSEEGRHFGVVRKGSLEINVHAARKGKIKTGK